jgi:vacuolar-type H+-ATPase subunit C/Vma6
VTGAPLTGSRARPISVGISGYEYGNTRLRARRSRLLSIGGYRGLFGSGSSERMLGSLRSTAYGPDVEQALVRQDPLQRLDDAIRRHLARSLGDLRRFYTGRPADGVELLLGRWDLRNLLAIVRGMTRPGAAPQLDAMLVPAGNLDAAALSELTQQPSLRSVIELMVAWDIPSRETARRLLRSWPDYETTGDAIVFEHALNLAWAEAVAGALGDWVGTDLEDTLRAEVDQINLLATLRRRADADSGIVGPAEAYLPGGTLDQVLLERVGRATTALEAAALLATLRMPAGWDAAVTAWVADDDLSALAGNLERAIARAAIGRFVHGDPLGIAIPVAFVWAKECEARNVRLVGRAIVHGLAWIDVEQELFP